MPKSVLSRPLSRLSFLIATCAVVAAFATGILAMPTGGAEAIGTISVSSDPDGASVYVDGAFVGQTPLNLARVTSGDHRVRVVKDGYLENARVVRVAEGKADTVRVRLTARTALAAGPQRGAPAPPAQAGDALRIVVISGEDSVNIVQQKTATAPVVEVRDRNNLPVAGASVVFLIGGGGNSATLANGVQQVTLTTDALGRATTTVNPLSRGAVQIQVRASYQGQTATATVNQTNFQTAAQAAQAGRTPSQAGNSATGTTTATTTTAAAGGAGGAAGGGLSTLAIAGIAGGAAAGTIVAVKVAKSNKPPTIASVTATPNAALLGTNTTIAFTASASDPDNDSLTYSWDFGDGVTGTGATASHAYATAGTFTVKVTVTDGKDSVNNQTTVTIRTLTGTWRGSTVPSNFGNVNFIYNLTQTGSNITGTAPAVVGSVGPTPSGTITTGSVRSTSPRVSFTATYPPLIPVNFTGDPSADANTIVGVLNDSGYVNEPITLTRQ